MKSVKVLWIEDGMHMERLLNSTLSADIDLVIADNLIEAYGQLYDYPGIDAFDKVVIDLVLESPSINRAVYKRIMPELLASVTTRIAHGDELLGLDFYKRVLLTRPATKDQAETKCALCSGYISAAHNMGLLTGLKIPLLDKGSEGLYADLMAFLMNSRGAQE